MKTQKYVKGQVWYVNFHGMPIEEGIISKSRPHLIIGINNANFTRGASLNMLPISSSELNLKDDSTLSFKYSNTYNCVLVAQMRTVPVGRLTTYLCTMDEELYNAVMAKFCEHLDLPATFPVSDTVELTNSVEINEDEKQEELADKPKFSATRKFVRVTPKKVVVKPEVKKPEVVEESTVRRRVWTPAKMEQFVKDYDTLKVSEMAKKYDLSTSGVRSSLTAFRKKLGLPSLSSMAEKKLTSLFDNSDKQFKEDYFNMTVEELSKKYNMGNEALNNRYKEIIDKEVEDSKATKSISLNCKRLTAEEKTEFLKDYSNMGTKGVVNKYGFDNAQQAYSLKSAILKSLRVS